MNHDGILALEIFDIISIFTDMAQALAQSLYTPCFQMSMKSRLRMFFFTDSSNHQVCSPERVCSSRGKGYIHDLVNNSCLIFIQFNFYYRKKLYPFMVHPHTASSQVVS